MENLPTSQPKIQPITCPHCGSRELAFITEYHKALFAKLLSAVFVAIIIFTFFVQDFEYIFIYSLTDTKYEFDGSKYIALGIALFFTKIGEYITESRTHIQVICKDCGNQWLFN